ncbi:hypothetical protein BDV96DRAFT_639136 [Lophiotrema nucula]|uniref:DUF7730 domain-containing protein n=1 Tax=Lophiotrema nucula TaxID=690887 RepID=A0A6A5ZTG9_9PLEO|nr:hypothetical protein BDV96DRAFT_639136 [Lophiotrema nucula]
MDPQLGCGLFRTPTEIRHAIYAYLDLPKHIHVVSKKNRSRLFRCAIGDNPREQDHIVSIENEWDCSHDRPKKLGLQARRLRSTFAEHWCCEEIALGWSELEEENKTIDLVDVLLVCKRVCIDLSSFLANKANILINDIETLDAIGRRLEEPTASEPVVMMISALDVRHLSVILRLPLSFALAFDDSSDDPLQMQQWELAWRSLANVKSLRNVNVWLDHDDPSSWSIVNERDIASSIEALSVMRPNTTVSINLPNLHPKYETPERHFMDDESASSSLEITRRERQSYFADSSNDGSVIRKFDFPNPGMQDLLYFALDSHLRLRGHGHEEVSRQWKSGKEAEALEEQRAMWRRGVDVDKYERDLQEQLNETYCSIPQI